MAVWVLYQCLPPILPSSIWSSLASSTSINKAQVMQNAALRTTTGCTQDKNICMTKHSYFPYTSTYSSTRHSTTENTTSITPLTQTYNILQHSKAKKNTIFNNGRYTTNFPQSIQQTYKETCVIYIHLLSLGI